MSQSRQRSVVAQFKGQSVFIESEVKRAQLYRNGELTKLLGKLGIRIEDFLTPTVNYVVTVDASKCSKSGGTNTTTTNQPSPITISPTKPTRPESRAQRSIRLAMEKTEQPAAASVVKTSSSKRDKGHCPRYYQLDHFVKLVKRWCLQNKKANQDSLSSPKPAQYKTPHKLYLSPTSSSNSKRVERERQQAISLPEPRPLIKPFLRIDDVAGILRPSFVENMPLPILKIEAVDNDGCPFAGYDKKQRESRKKNAKKAKAGSCEICDEKFDDEDAHVASEKHQRCLDRKRHQFERVMKSCEAFFPNGIDGFLNRLDEFNAGPVPSPMPISVLTEPDSELSVEQVKKEAPYRDTKVESSFEKKDEVEEEEEEPLLDDGEDWMFQNGGVKSRKVSHESMGNDSLMDEVEMLQAKVQNIPTELSSTLDTNKQQQQQQQLEQDKKDQLKRKSTPAKGTYNPSVMGVLDQLGTSSCSKQQLLTSESVHHQQSHPSPIITTLKPTIEQSPKPPPLPLNLDEAENASSRSPALKKAMMETAYGEKRQVETLRNLRHELVTPRFTPVPKQMLMDKPKPNFDSPLPPPVMSAILVSPKTSKYTELRRADKKTPPATTSESPMSQDSPKLRLEHEATPEQMIHFGDQTTFKTPKKHNYHRHHHHQQQQQQEQHSSPVLTSKHAASPVIQYHEFPSRKTSIEVMDGPVQIELCQDENDSATGDESSNVSQIICDPEHGIITTDHGKIRKVPKVMAALRGLDQSAIYRDSPMRQARRAKKNAFSGLTAHCLDEPKAKKSSQYGETPEKRVQEGGINKTRSNAALTIHDNTYTLKAYAYESGEDEDEMGYQTKNKKKNKRGQRKTTLAAKHSIAETLEKEHVYEQGLFDESDLQASLDEQRRIDRMSPRSKERYFKGERVELRRTPTINMPSSSTDEHGNTVSDDSDEHPVTPEHHMIRTESDSEESSLTFHISPRPSTRIIKRDQKGPRRPNSNSSSSQHQRRRPERSCRTRKMDKPAYGFESSSGDEFR